MALARLVTRTPEFAQNLAHSLQAAGYDVEFMAPDDSPVDSASPADLEVNLDDPSAASSYVMTADGKEICFAYDPYEREFVLAPVWRSLKNLFTPLRGTRMRSAGLSAREETETAQPLGADVADSFAKDALVESRSESVNMPSAEPHLDIHVAAEAIHDQDSALTTEMNYFQESAPAVPGLTQSLYLPEPLSLAPEEPVEPVQFSGAEYFDGQGLRKNLTRPHEEISAPLHLDSAPLPLDEAALHFDEAEPEAAPRAIEGGSDPIRDTPSPQTPWLVSMAERAESARSSLSATWKQRRNTIATSTSRLRGYDAAWLRSAPVAAVITLAFLVGWGFSSSRRPAATHPVTVNGNDNSAKVQQSSMVRLPAPALARAKKPAAVVPKSRAQRVSYRNANVDDDGEIASDVVIRHYPAKNSRRIALASAQKPAVKRISDLN